MTINIGFLSSHGGSNMQAIIDACKEGRLNGNPCVVISNNSNSTALLRAKSEGIQCHHLSQKIYPQSEDLDNVILDTLQKHSVDIVLLVGYMKKLGERTLKAYKGRILNIHPSLLPKYGGKGMYGLNVHKAVIKANEKVTGVTIHSVDGEYDTGSIINQCEVPVYGDDTAESLSERVLKTEHEFIVETLLKISKGELQL